MHVSKVSRRFLCETHFPEIETNEKGNVGFDRAGKKLNSIRDAGLEVRTDGRGGGGVTQTLHRKRGLETKGERNRHLAQ